MLKGLYAAASAMLANLDQQGILSHNLANIDTPGFRQVLGQLQPFETTTAVSNPAYEPSQQSQVLGALGLGVETNDTLTDFSQGSLQSTGQPLDVGIEGDGFFRVQTPAGERYTRDGRFQQDANGQLVTVDGFHVLDANGNPLTLPQGTVGIDLQGQISVDGKAAGQLGLATFADPNTGLVRDSQSGNTFQAVTAPGTGAPGTVQQGYVEMANTDESQLMTQMVTVGQAYAAAQRMVQVQDNLLGQSISQLGSLT